MKIDITSGHSILSRKIRVCLMALSFFIAAAFPAFKALAAEPQNSILWTVDNLRSTPSSELSIVDTRSSWKFFLGHIPGAVHLGSWEDFTHKVEGVRGLLIEDPQTIVEKLKPAGIDKNKTIVVYGDPGDPWRTDGRFFWMFERYGFDRVVLLEGGWDAWQAAGGSIERGKSQSAPSSLTARDLKLNPAVIADAKWIHQRLGSKNLVLIDNRTKKEYEGATPYGSPRGGHIPGAIHIHWPDFFNAGGRLKFHSELQSLLARHNINKGQEIVVYCTGGVRSGMGYFVFKYLGYPVRNYDGSWWDWSQESTLPVESF